MSSSQEMEEEDTGSSRSSWCSSYISDEDERCRTLLMKLPETLGQVTLEDKELELTDMDIRRKDIDKLQELSLYFVRQEEAEESLSVPTELRNQLKKALCALFVGFGPASLSSLFRIACCEDGQHNTGDCSLLWEDLKRSSLEMILNDTRLRVAKLAEDVLIGSERTESVERELRSEMQEV